MQLRIASTRKPTLKKLAKEKHNQRTHAHETIILKKKQRKIYCGIGARD